MDDETLTGESPDEDDSLSETIAAALEEDRGENIIAELGHAETAAQETPETDDEALSDDGNGAETPGDDGGAGQTEKTEPTSAEVREKADAHRQVAEAFNTAVEPYQAYLASRGVEPTQAVRFLLAAEHQLSTGAPEQKAKILAKLAKDYGVDLDALYDVEDAAPVSPEIAQIQQRIAGVERMLAGERQQVVAQVRQDAEAEVAAFTEEKDTAGKPLRPHLEKVRVTMGRMIDEDPTLTLATAYENAVWANPNLRKGALAKQRAAPASQSKPGKAKKAKPVKEPSLRDIITEEVHHDAERAGA